MKKYFVTGIGTGVGKTLCAAIIAEALRADYWKPVQAGELDNTDTDKVKALVSSEKVFFHKEAFSLSQPMSPHAAAKADGVEIRLNEITVPLTQNHLVIEGAGGLMVPVNSKGDLVIDLIAQFEAQVILVSQNYLGSINHTLLSAEVLRSRGFDVKGIIFNGVPNPATEEIILNVSQLKCLGRIPLANRVDKEFVKHHAEKLKAALL